MMKKTKSQIKSDIRSSLYDGKSHELIFNELKGQYQNHEELFEMVCNYPTLSQMKRFKLLQNSLLILLASFTIAMLIISQAIFNAFLFGGLIYSLKKWSIKSYLYVYIVNVYLLIISIVPIFYYELSINYSILIVCFYLISSSALALYLDLNLSPKHKVEKEKYRDEKGRLRLRKVFRFV